MTEKRCDAVVIGAGPGGYVAAIRLAQLGQKTILVEREALGGVCLNWGCIPSKALIHAGKVVEQIRHAADMGITVGGEPAVDLKKLVSWKDGVVGRLTGGIGQLMKANGVEVVMGSATLTDARTVKVEGDDPCTISARSILLATGSSSIQIPGFETDGELVHDNRTLLALETIPERLAVIGGGVIGLELGTFFSKVGSQVTVIELMDQLLPGVDPDLVKVVARELKKKKVKVHTKTKANGMKVVDGKAVLTIETPKGEQELEVDAVLVSVGRRPNSKGLGLEAAGVAVDERGFVKVNDRLETTAPGVYAIGDLCGGPLLAHKASKEGLVAADNIAGKDHVYDVRAMPGAIFTDPEVATVGLTDTEATAQDYTPDVGTFPFAASGRALSTGETAGFVKLVSDHETGAILGAGIVGPEASNLIAEVALAIELGATVEDLALTVHAHPTLPECIMEAAEGILGHPVHVAPSKK